MYKLHKRKREKAREYIVGKGSSGLTLGAIVTMFVSGRVAFPVAPVALSFFSFLTDEPCFPPSADLF